MPLLLSPIAYYVYSRLSLASFKSRQFIFLRSRLMQNYRRKHFHLIMIMFLVVFPAICFYGFFHNVCERPDYHKDGRCKMTSIWTPF